MTKHIGIQVARRIIIKAAAVLCLGVATVAGFAIPCVASTTHATAAGQAAHSAVAGQAAHSAAAGQVTPDDNSPWP
jgi:hypothetical protein